MRVAALALVCACLSDPRGECARDADCASGAPGSFCAEGICQGPPRGTLEAVADRPFARSESLTDEGLADYLGCTREALVKVRLCGTPYAKPPAFARDVAAIAQRFGLNEKALLKAVRRGTVVLQMQSAPKLSLAARDRKPEEPS